LKVSECLIQFLIPCETLSIDLNFYLRKVSTPCLPAFASLLVFKLQLGHCG
jgi:hypothetical protein